MNCAGVDAQIPHNRGVGQRPEAGSWEDSRKKRILAVRDGCAMEIQGGQRGQNSHAWCHLHVRGFRSRSRRQTENK